jgi:hypothetical protein
MLGFIKNLIAGIINFIIGLLPGKKKAQSSEYYLELKEDGTETQLQPAAKPATPSVAAKAPAKAVKPQPEKPPVVPSFSINYLLPLGGSGSRRRPGVNMNIFLDMAAQVKTPGVN